MSGRVFDLIAEALRIFRGQAPQERPMATQTDPPDVADRARAALLAHACGARFGAPLESVTDASVGTRAVRLGNWTDDTHMSLYLHDPGGASFSRQRSQ